MEIDQDLRRRMAAHPETTERVVLCCRASAHIDDGDLARAGFRVGERLTVEDECFIHGDVKLGDVRGLSAIPGIEAVSSAPDAEIC